MLAYARFLAKTQDGPNGCLEWTGSRNKDGYGRFRDAGFTYQAHRWIYWHLTGNKPQVVRHICDNPRCVRIDHLLAGTQADNVTDSIDRGRKYVAMTPQLVKHFRDLPVGRGVIRREAIRLGLDINTATRAAKRETWKCLP